MQVKHALGGRFAQQLGGINDTGFSRSYASDFKTYEEWRNI